MAGKFRNNPSYLQIADLLQELHVLMGRGLGDTAEADSLREQMDGPWRKLTDEERSRIEGLSADLYTLEPDSPIAHPLEHGIYSEELAGEVRRARDAEDPNRVLALLRSRPAEISADRAAALRALCYERLGERDVATQFLEHAVRISTSPDSYAVSLLIHLLQGSHHRQAVGWAREISSIVKAPSPQLLWMTAEVFRSTSGVNGGDSQYELLDQAIGTYTRALEQLRHVDLDPQQRLLALACHLGTAVCQYLLHNQREALIGIEAALRLDPNDDAALTMRGLLLGGSNWPDAVQDFRRAIDHQARSVWPYFYVAYDALTAGDYRRCLELCSAAMLFSSGESVVAELYEWTAICLAELSAPSDLVETNFQAALDLRPHDRRIVGNRERFRASRRTAASRPSQWTVGQDVEPAAAVDSYVRDWPKRWPAPVAAV